MRDSRERTRMGHLLDIMLQVGRLLCLQGVEPASACRLGKEVTDYLCLHWGGQSIYLPKEQSRRLAERDVQICAEFNGKNVAGIAAKFGLTEVRIYQILHAVRKRRHEGMKMGVRKGSARPASTALDDLVVHVTKALCLKGVDVETAAGIAREVSDFQRQHWGGLMIYIPEKFRHTYAARAREIFASLDESSLRTLAGKHGLSEEMTYQLIGELVKQLGRAGQKIVPKYKGLRNRSK